MCGSKCIYKYPKWGKIMRHGNLPKKYPQHNIRNSTAKLTIMFSDADVLSEGFVPLKKVHLCDMIEEEILRACISRQSRNLFHCLKNLKW